MEPDPPSTDRRENLRHRALKEAQIVIKGSSTIDCVVRNMSAAGARLGLRSTIDVPDQFDLLIVREDLLHPCQKIWRTGDTLGVNFTGEPRRRILKLKAQAAFSSAKTDSRRTGPAFS
jgi:hypothetical protein